MEDPRQIATGFAAELYRAPELAPLDREITVVTDVLERGMEDGNHEMIEKTLMELNGVKEKRLPFMEMADIYSLGLLAYRVGSNCPPYNPRP